MLLGRFKKSGFPVCIGPPLDMLPQFDEGSFVVVAVHGSQEVLQ